MKTKHLIKLAIAILLAVLFFYLCFRQVDFFLVLSYLKQASVPFLLVACLCSLLVVGVNTALFKVFLPPSFKISFRRLFEVVSVFSMAVNLLPFGGGQALLVYLLGHREKAGKTATLSLLTLEQIADGFSKIILFLLVAFLAPLPTWLKSGMKGLIFVIGALYIFLFFVSYFHPKYAEALGQGDDSWWGGFKRFFANWAKNLYTLRDWRKTIEMIFLAVLMKSCQVLSVYFIQWSMGVPLGLFHAVFVVVAISLATTLPLTPGRLGLVESAALLTYRYLGLSSDQALALGLLIHAAQLVPYLIAGYISSVKLGLRSREIGFEAKETMAPTT